MVEICVWQSQYEEVALIDGRKDEIAVKELSVKSQNSSVAATQRRIGKV